MRNHASVSSPGTFFAVKSMAMLEQGSCLPAVRPVLRCSEVKVPRGPTWRFATPAEKEELFKLLRVDSEPSFGAWVRGALFSRACIVGVATPLCPLSFADLLRLVVVSTRMFPILRHVVSAGGCVSNGLGIALPVLRQTLHERRRVRVANSCCRHRPPQLGASFGLRDFGPFSRSWKAPSPSSESYVELIRREITRFLTLFSKFSRLGAT